MSRFTKSAQRAVIRAGLELVRAKLIRPDSWIKGESARNKDGNSVEANSAEACSWCLLGAIYSVGSGIDVPGETYTLYTGMCLAIEDVMHEREDRFRMITTMNDNSATKHGDVLKLLKDVISDLSY